ncbi:MAG: TlpA family protein disulfide reductase [Azonexus sp.]|nr:TlpA family protein disulfide reductase [Azonexus sp.]
MKRRFAALLLALSVPLAAAEQAAALFAATLADVDDRPVALARYRSQPLIVNFWARWCGPCKQEIPELIAFRAAHKGQVEILGIGIEDRAAPVKDFAKAYEMDYPVFVAKEQGIPLIKALGNDKAGIPYTLFIDRRGEVVGKKMGVLKKADLDAVKAALLAK